MWWIVRAEWWCPDGSKLHCFGFSTSNLSGVYLGLITGSVVATQKDSRLHAHRLLLVRHLGLDGVPDPGAEDVALDPGLDAGVGDAVLVVKEGAVVADLFDQGQPEGARATPANVVIVAVVDDWTPRS